MIYAEDLAEVRPEPVGLEGRDGKPLAFPVLIDIVQRITSSRHDGAGRHDPHHEVHLELEASHLDLAAQQ